MVEKTHATKTMPTLGADFVAMLVIVHCSCEVVSFLKSCCVQCICKVQQYTVCSHKPSGIKFKQPLEDLQNEELLCVSAWQKTTRSRLLRTPITKVNYALNRNFSELKAKCLAF